MQEIHPLRGNTPTSGLKQTVGHFVLSFPGSWNPVFICYVAQCKAARSFTHTTLESQVGPSQTVGDVILAGLRRRPAVRSAPTGAEWVLDVLDIWRIVECVTLGNAISAIHSTRKFHVPTTWESLQVLIDFITFCKYESNNLGYSYCFAFFWLPPLFLCMLYFFYCYFTSKGYLCVGSEDEQREGANTCMILNMLA